MNTNYKYSWKFVVEIFHLSAKKNAGVGIPAFFR
jgi:hypothetical protein